VSYTYRTIVPEEWDRRRRYQFLTSAILSRPVGWISTVSAAGVPNLAPLSWFNTVCADLVMVMIAIGRRKGRYKDASANIRETSEFVVNVVTESVAARMVQTGADYPPKVGEFDAVGMTPIPSVQVSPPRVAESPVRGALSSYSMRSPCSFLSYPLSASTWRVASGRPRWTSGLLPP